MSSTSSAGMVLAAFTTYNPDVKLLERAISSIMPQVAETLIVDNGSSNFEAVQDLALRIGARVIAFRENRGIAVAYNAAFRYAKDGAFDWVITCDQDSVMPSGMISHFLGAEESYEGEVRIGIVCPNYYNRTTQRLEYSGESPRMIDYCISSGSLTLVSAWSEISGFDESMFIDGVDFEFCDRLIEAGCGVLLVPYVHMEHEIGSASLHGIPGHKFLVFNHSPFRKLYIAQNIIYRDGKRRDGRAGKVAYLRVLKQMLLVILYEKNKMGKLVRIIAGVMSGRKMLAKARETYD